MKIKSRVRVEACFFIVGSQYIFSVLGIKWGLTALGKGSTPQSHSPDLGMVLI